jgi:hypothetical protein
LRWNDIRKQIIVFIKKHIIILFMHKSIHNSDRKGIKYRMSYPRWSTSLVRINRQLIKMKQGRETIYLTILRPTLEYAAMVCDPTTQTLIDIRKCTKNSCPLRHKWLHQQNTSTRMRDKHVNITWVADFRTTEVDKQTQIQHQLMDIDRDLYLRPGDSRTRGQHRFFQERSNMTLSETPSKEQHESGTTNSEVFSCT